jgi:hypothetical protein
MLEIRPEEHATLVDGRPLSRTMREQQLIHTHSGIGCRFSPDG